MNYAFIASRALYAAAPVPLLHLLLRLLGLLLLFCSSTHTLDPASNGAVPACLALSTSLGPQVLPQCHIMLAPKLFGYNTSVEVSIEVKTIYGLGDTELMEWSGWFLMTWKDPRLAWNATATGVEQLRIERSNLWLPDIGYWNAKEVEYFDLRNAKFLEAIASSDGSVYTYIYTSIQFPCSLDMRLFPFDQQACVLEIGAINSDSSVFTLSLSSHVSSSQGGTAFFGVGEWDLKALTQEAKLEVTSSGLSFEYVNLRFHLERRVTYYAILMIVPYELLSLLASIMFFAEQQGDRANVSIAIIMSMTLYVLIASQSAPKSMNFIPLVGLFLIVQMLLLIAFTFVAIFRPGQPPPSLMPLVVDDVMKPIGASRRLLRACHIALVRHKDGICFASYILASGFNALIFLCIWPQVARRNV